MCSSDLDKHLGKKTRIEIDKQGQIDTCKVQEIDKGDGRKRPIDTLIEKGVTAKQREEMEWQKQREASKSMSRGLELGF